MELFYPHREKTLTKLESWFTSLQMALSTLCTTLTTAKKLRYDYILD